MKAGAFEQSGPLRAVVKITGKHKSVSSDRAWLPFVVRLYFFAGSDSIRIVHTFIFDGDQQKDIDVAADEMMRRALRDAPVAAILSEEVALPETLNPAAPLCVAIDPDGLPISFAQVVQNAHQS